MVSTIEGFHCSEFIISFVPDWKQLVKFLWMAMVAVHYHLEVVFASIYVLLTVGSQKLRSWK